MEPSPIVIDGITFPSVESYYQSQKTVNKRKQLSFTFLNGKQAKKKGRELNIRKDWEEIKVKVMLKGLRAKFKPDNEWGRQLIATGKEEITEWNNWGDKIWGKSIYDGEGQNLLGKLLMQVRKELYEVKQN